MIPSRQTLIGLHAEVEPRKKPQNPFTMASDTIAQFEAELSSIAEAHKRLASQFEMERVTGPRTTNRDLMQALLTLHTIAQFIRGDFDARVNEVVGKTGTRVIFSGVQQHFAALDHATKSMRDTLNTIKEEVITPSRPEWNFAVLFREKNC